MQGVRQIIYIERCQNMKSVTFLLVLIFIIPATSFSREALDSEKEYIEIAVKAKLKDPESSKFKNIKLSEDMSFCGDVNAKNGFGGYSGFSKFYGMYLPREKVAPVVVVIGISDDDSSEKAITQMCLDKKIL